MKSFVAKYEEVQRKNPFWSSYVVFINTIMLGKFGRKAAYAWFGKLVDKDDYAPDERHALLSYLGDVAERAEEGRKMGLICPVTNV